MCCDGNRAPAVGDSSPAGGVVGVKLIPAARQLPWAGVRSHPHVALHPAFGFAGSGPCPGCSGCHAWLAGMHKASPCLVTRDGDGLGEAGREEPSWHGGMAIPCAGHLEREILLFTIPRLGAARMGAQVLRQSGAGDRMRWQGRSSREPAGSWLFLAPAQDPGVPKEHLDVSGVTGTSLQPSVWVVAVRLTK